uniref:ATP synthase F0 subunit 6 n=1 Tax=Sindiplozoon sp. DZ-2018 TaxID=2340795 RepID=A0A386PYP1_9PLAT|nr:ATP synthase F0 subunit 6 [Sindiplozoon sp. DZ-2018]
MLYLGSFYYSSFILLSVLALVVSQSFFSWSFFVVYGFAIMLASLRPYLLSFYNVFGFYKLFILSFPRDLPFYWASLFGFLIFLGEICSRFLRSIAVSIRLIVNLTLGYLVSLLLGVCLVNIFMFEFGLGFQVFLLVVFGGLLYFYELFICFLLGFVSHSMFLSLVIDSYEMSFVKFGDFSSLVNSSVGNNA